MTNAISDLQAINDKYQSITIMALVFVAAFHMVHPLALLRAAEQIGLAKSGAASRLKAKDPDWEEMYDEMFDTLAHPNVCRINPA